MPERVTGKSRSEKLAEAVVVRCEAGEGPNEKEWNPQ
jgi:hypothetical protein